MNSLPASTNLLIGAGVFDPQYASTHIGMTKRRELRIMLPGRLRPGGNGCWSSRERREKHRRKTAREVVGTKPSINSACRPVFGSHENRLLNSTIGRGPKPVSYTHLRAHETPEH